MSAATSPQVDTSSTIITPPNDHEPSTLDGPAVSAPAKQPSAPGDSPTTVDWKSVYPKEAWHQIRLEGIYLGLLAAVLGATVIAMLLLAPFSKHPETRPILICALGGITGSWMYSAKIYVSVVTRKEWNQDYIVWRLVSPFSGIFLSVSTYTTIRTGLLGVTFTPHETDANYLNYYAYAIGFLVGLFSDEVMGKLAEVAKTIFGAATKSNSLATPEQTAEPRENN